MGKLEKIKIELELDPPIALLLGTFVHQTAQGSLEVFSMMTKDGREQMMKLGQNIVDQVAEKTNFDPVKDKLKDISKTMNGNGK